MEGNERLISMALPLGVCRSSLSPLSFSPGVKQNGEIIFQCSLCRPTSPTDKSLRRTEQEFIALISGFARVGLHTIAIWSPENEQGQYNLEIQNKIICAFLHYSIIILHRITLFGAKMRNSQMPQMSYVRTLIFLLMICLCSLYNLAIYALKKKKKTSCVV